eukprot:scaffold1396_cov252-Pinguiococcus_pyrenoidosus.AAC.30
MPESKPYLTPNWIACQHSAAGMTSPRMTGRQMTAAPTLGKTTSGVLSAARPRLALYLPAF